jgi:hypothetical protein
VERGRLDSAELIDPLEVTPLERLERRAPKIERAEGEVKAAAWAAEHERARGRSLAQAALEALPSELKAERERRGEGQSEGQGERPFTIVTSRLEPEQGERPQPDPAPAPLLLE